MEMLSWMRKVDAGMENRDLLELIDNMHEVIDALITKNQENEKVIGQLKKELDK